MLFQADLRGVDPSVTLERLDRDPAARALLDERDSLTEEVPIVPEPHPRAGESRATPADEAPAATPGAPRDAADAPGAPRDAAAAPGAPRDAADADTPVQASQRTPRGSVAPSRREPVTAPAVPGRAGSASGWTEAPDPADAPDLDGFTRTLVLGVESNRAAIDELISRYSRRWAIPRMPVVDRNVLRLATYELLHEPTPPAVVIDEAIGLAKRLSTEDSGRFVNGVLESIRKELAEARTPPTDSGEA